MNKIFCRIIQYPFGFVNKIINKPNQIIVPGEGMFIRSAAILKKKNIKNPMIVTGKRIASSEEFMKFTSVIDNKYTLYDKVTPDPTIILIEEMVKLYQDKECDGIVAIGGGSNIDAAKAMGARLVRPNKTLKQLGGIFKIHKALPFFMAVPTTAGTGSEITVASVVTDNVNNHKYAISDPCLIPDIAVLDPKMTVTMPPSLTANTGMDALCHAIEAYLNRIYYNRETQALTLQAICDIYKYLPIAYKDGNNIEARDGMLKASYTAGKAFTVACVGNVHAIAHTIGGLYHISHGLACAVVMPYVLDEYAKAKPSRIARLADMFALAEGKNDTEKAKAFIDSIRDLNKFLNIPNKLDCIKDKDIDKMATWAEKEANPVYPVPVIFNKEKFKEVIKRCQQ